uniref:Large ribosomal subunit protein mL42 n=1 Tax=Lepisosteus oculatus TaxID=7918 RepID=W5NDU5_LEPOC
GLSWYQWPQHGGGTSVQVKLFIRTTTVLCQTKGFSSYKSKVHSSQIHTQHLFRRLQLPIPQPDPLNRPEETHDQVLKAHLNKEVLRNKQAPTIEELSKMFYTTKHRWYPVGQYHRRRKKTDPPRDR